MAKPIIKPLVRFEVSWMTRMRDRVITPPPPMPTKTLPRTNTAKLRACEVTMAPMENQTDENKIMTCGENCMARRPISGEMLDMLMRYELVSHMADS